MPRKPCNLSSCMGGPIKTFTVTSPIGDLELVSCPRGIHDLSLQSVSSDKDFSPDPSMEIHVVGHAYKPVTDSVNWLTAYFHKKATLSAISMPPICHLMKPSPEDTFTSRVWYTLKDKVGFGDTVSYGQLAEMSGSTHKASRAVGQAMRTNPVMIIVPCHRVLPSTGKVGNYSGGSKNSVKAWLLKHEGCQL